MTMRYDAALMFGYQIHPVPHLTFEEVDGNGLLDLPWLSGTPDGVPAPAGAADFVGRLYMTIPDADPTVTDWHQQGHAVRDRYGVTFVEDGWALRRGSTRSCLLAAYTVQGRSGATRPVNLGELVAIREQHDLDEKLGVVLRVLGLTPKHEPQWLLAVTSADQV
ncbi:hypothetical protein ACWT_6148 [Actinoplanes sp. SE50]|uniref:hypothetical protein n=1 Tax=unclassified Actinoplanes TaxID=2626549 RepID=UPI00023ECD59|nr:MULTISPECIES: hypothetical protein [unclassified Actinoplanes]AEV87162.1 hypothetical protein ACPL_6280 [Actinoplanes sp. SE50/110]ATO85563.1 hypothetical protein ACWT_6148 [Actinoplanes sp. SE50]SLM02976.1 hypothetical protein ACSP50_6261 [Actinoplanes sp. SE50/110]